METKILSIIKESMMIYRQCKLEKKLDTEAGQKVQTVWIPIQYAVLDKILEVKDYDGHWVNGWKVVYVGATAMDEYVRKHERDYKELPSIRFGI